MFVWYPKRGVIEKASHSRGYFDSKRFPIFSTFNGQRPEDCSKILRASLNPDDLRAQQVAYHLPPLRS